MPAAEMSPTAGLPPATPFTLQSTAVSAVPVTVAAYWAEVPSVTLVGPFRSSVTGVVSKEALDGAESATPRLCEEAGLATLVAVIVTFEDCGALTGAR
jgi:hypothetical protein